MNELELKEKIKRIVAKNKRLTRLLVKLKQENRDLRSKLKSSEEI